MHRKSYSLLLKISVNVSKRLLLNIFLDTPLYALFCNCASVSIGKIFSGPTIRVSFNFFLFKNQVHCYTKAQKFVLVYGLSKTKGMNLLMVEFQLCEEQLSEVLRCFLRHTESHLFLYDVYMIDSIIKF